MGALSPHLLSPHLDFPQFEQAQKSFAIPSLEVSRDMKSIAAGLVIFFSLTGAPLPEPAPTPPNTPKRTRNGPETEPKRSRNRAERSRNGAKRSRNGPKSSPLGWDGRGGFVGVAGDGGCKGKRKSLRWASKPTPDSRPSDTVELKMITY